MGVDFGRERQPIPTYWDCLKLPTTYWTRVIFGSQIGRVSDFSSPLNVGLLQDGLIIRGRIMALLLSRVDRDRFPSPYPGKHGSFLATTFWSKARTPFLAKGREGQLCSTLLGRDESSYSHIKNQVPSRPLLLN